MASDSLLESTAPGAIPYPDRFAKVQSRPVLDYALRTIQQTQTQLSAMADTKASLMITVCSIVLTVGFTQIKTESLLWPLVLLASFTLMALVFAILAVLPASKSPRTSDGRVDVAAPWFNLFFFGHFAELPRERFEELLADVASDDAKVYSMLARDIYGQGIVLANKKYRMLRWSYLTFLIGFFFAAAGALWSGLRGGL